MPHSVAELWHKILSHDASQHHIIAAAVSGLSILTLLSLTSRSNQAKSRTVSKTQESSKRFTFYTNPQNEDSQIVWTCLLELHVRQEDVAFVPVPNLAELTFARHFDDKPTWAKAVGLTSTRDLEKLHEWFVGTVSRDGELPVLVDAHGKEAASKGLTGAEVIVEYLDTKLVLFPALSLDVNDWIRVKYALECCPHREFFDLLTNQHQAHDEELSVKVMNKLKRFVLHMAPLTLSKDAFYLGSRFSFADVFAGVYVMRFAHALFYYRSMDILAPERWGIENSANGDAAKESHDLLRFKQWMNAVSKRPSLVETSIELKEMLKYYNYFANHAQIKGNQWVGRGIGPTI